MRLEGGGPRREPNESRAWRPGAIRASLPHARGGVLALAHRRSHAALACCARSAALPPARGRPLPRALGEGGRGRVRRLRGAEAAAPRRGAGPAAPAPRAAAPAPGIDPSLDLPVEVQQRVLEFEAAPRPAVPRDPRRRPRRGRRRRSSRPTSASRKQFHPDRYFRRNLGPYARARRAHLQEGRSRPTSCSRTRPRAPRSSAAWPRTPRPRPPSGGGSRPEAAPSAKSARPAPADARRLRARLREPRRSIAAPSRSRKRQGQELLRVGHGRLHEGALARGRRRACASRSPSIPETTRTRAPSPTCSASAHEERARALLKEADGALASWATTGRAPACYEEALHYRPFDAELSHKTGRLRLGSGGDLRKAKEYAVAACELEPESRPTGAPSATSTRPRASARTRGASSRRALRLDPTDAESKQNSLSCDRTGWCASRGRTA